MDKSLDELIREVEEFFQEKKDLEILEILSDELLEKHDSAFLYGWKSRVLLRLKKTNESLQFAQNAINKDKQNSIGYFARANVWYYQKEYDKAIDDYNVAINLDRNDARAYFNRGLVWYEKKEYDKAIEDNTSAINLNKDYATAYNSRGNAWNGKKQFDKAIDDFSTAIKLNKDFAYAYNNRGNAWSGKREYEKALADYNQAIAIDANYVNVYRNRGLTWYDKKEYVEAIKDFNQAIKIDKNDAMTYYNRAAAYAEQGELKHAIDDYRHYIVAANNSTDYYVSVAKSEIEKLLKNIGEGWRAEIENIIGNLKSLLLFNKDCITHYTSLSATKSMILEASPFRLSEGAFLNDPAEGIAILKYLSFSIIKEVNKKNKEELFENFTEKPFIGSFVNDHKHNDLTLWRMYGKEALAEARGCALTFNRTKFIAEFEDKILNRFTLDINSRDEGRYTFYKVAYIHDEEFLIPGGYEEDKEKNEEEVKQLNILMTELKEKINALDGEQKISIASTLNEIVYLFKSDEYHYEHEVRLVVQSVGLDEYIKVKPDKDEQNVGPRVYVEMIDIAPVLTQITLGPKVERAEEWAAAFNYHLKKKYKGSDVKIVLSHIPFK